MCGICHLNRRRLLAGMAAAASTGLAGCVENTGIALVSDAQVEALGRQSWDAITQSTPASRNTQAVGAAEAVTSRLLAAAGEPRSAWEMRVFAGSEVNAFVLPGRKIGIYEGLFRVAQSPDQLATVVGHEIGHLAADHGAERINAQAATDLGLGLVEALLTAGDVGGAREIAGALGVGVEFGLIRPYSRQQELEADAYGLRLMRDAGYDPRQAIVLWERMAQLDGSVPELVSTHPAPATRIAEMRGLIDDLA